MDGVCQNVQQNGKGQHDGLLWLLMVAAVAVFGTREAWLQERWRLLGVKHVEWKELRRRLQDVMWIDMIQDRGGKEVSDALSDV